MTTTIKGRLDSFDDIEITTTELAGMAAAEQFAVAQDNLQDLLENACTVRAIRRIELKKPPAKQQGIKTQRKGSKD